MDVGNPSNFVRIQKIFNNDAVKMKKIFLAIVIQIKKPEGLKGTTSETILLIRMVPWVIWD